MQGSEGAPVRVGGPRHGKAGADVGNSCGRNWEDSERKRGMSLFT